MIFQDNIKENIKHPRYLTFVRGSTSGRCIPFPEFQYVEHLKGYVNPPPKPNAHPAFFW